MGSPNRGINTKEEIDDSLYSRQRYVLGDDAMKRLAKANVFIMGMDGLGIEIAKNVVLSGVKSVTIKDDTIASANDLGTQFFLRKEDVQAGRPRAAGCIGRLAELNSYVKVEATDVDLMNGDLGYLKNFQCIVLVGCPLGFQLRVNAFCRKQTPQIKFISANVFGLYSSLICDFGNKFEVVDHDGIEPSQFLVGYISRDNPAVLTSLDAQHHFLQTDDTIMLKEVIGMSELNGKCFQVEVDSPFQLKIKCDTTSYGEYKNGGIALEVKQPKCFSFESLETQLKSPKIMTFDWGKSDNISLNFLLVISVCKFLEMFGKKPNSQEDFNELFNIATRLNDGLTNKVEDLSSKLTRDSLKFLQHQFAPLCAALGGIAAQEVLKAVTGKFSPLQEWFLLDATELISGANAFTMDESSRYMPLYSCVGEELATKLANITLFMVGCGAIGCEMLKNLALLGIGSGKNGQLIITDNDLIEKSNLNRQFLFRQRHIQKPKSVTAAGSAKEINGDVRINARQDKVCPDTESIYNDDFFESCDIVINALDNIEARRYMDSRCVANRRPLIDTGTLGPRGHVQVVVPFMTECYSSQSDPADQEIPYCTLKSFPQSIDHTIQWARDKFGSCFWNKPSSFNKLWEKYGTPLKLKEAYNSTEHLPDEFVAAISLLRKRPKNWTECIQMARIRFEKYFNHTAKQLLHVFPLEHKLQDGTSFWQSPKRPPKPIVFDAENQWHMNFIDSAAKLIAKIYGIKVHDDVSLKEAISETRVPSFSPTRKEIALDDEEAKNLEAKADIGKIEALQKYLSDVIERNEFSDGVFTMFPETFEKDDDSNSHIDFITAASNLRAEMYNIEPVDRYKTKRIAGKIIPAIATTTAAIAGLATIELIKIIAKFPMEKMRNWFLNLAVTCFVPTTPMSVQFTRVTDDLSFSIWDRWDVQGNESFTLQQFLDHIQGKANMKVSMVMQGAKIIYIPFFPGHDKRLSERMLELLGPANDVRHIDLTLGFESGSDDYDELACPPVRYVF